jgi:hypothetical protein
MGVGWELAVKATPRPIYPQERDPVPIAHGAGWAPGLDWTSAGNFALPPGFDHRNVQPATSRYSGENGTYCKRLLHGFHDLEMLSNKTVTVICVRKSLIDLVNQSSLNTRQIKRFFADPPSRHCYEQTSGV